MSPSPSDPEVQNEPRVQTAVSLQHLSTANACVHSQTPRLVVEEIVDASPASRNTAATHFSDNLRANSNPASCRGGTRSCDATTKAMGDTGEVVQAAVSTRSVHASRPVSKENQAAASTTMFQSISTESAERHSGGGGEDYELGAGNHGLGPELANLASIGSTSQHEDAL